MARLTFTGHLRDLAPTAASRYEGATLGAVLNGVFTDHPRLKHYILDDQNRVRQHVIIFINDEEVPRDQALATEVNDTSDIYVLQALSGGAQAEGDFS